MPAAADTVVQGFSTIHAPLSRPRTSFSPRLSQHGVNRRATSASSLSPPPNRSERASLIRLAAVIPAAASVPMGARLCGGLGSIVSIVLGCLFIVGLVRGFSKGGGRGLPYLRGGHHGSTQQAADGTAARIREIVDAHAAGVNELVLREPLLAAALEKTVEAVLSWEPLGTDDLAAVCEVDLAVGCSFGAGPGPAGPFGQQNYAIASSAFKLVKACGGSEVAPPLFLQWEIADALRERYNVTTSFRVSIPPDADYISTFDVVQQVAREVARRGLGPPLGRPLRVAVLAHPDHAWRAAALARAEGWGPVVVSGALGPDWAMFGCDSEGYTAESTQPWTRTRVAFLEHEIWVRPKDIADGHL